MKTPGDFGRPFRVALRRLIAATAMAATLMATMLVGPSAVSAAGWGCNVEPPLQHFWTGREPHTSISEAGVAASIDPATTMAPCDTVTFTTVASAWVAVIPGSGNSHYGDFNSILQAGVIVEHQAFDVSRAYWFIASGGCGGATPTPIYLEGVHVPAFDWGVHRFVVVATSLDFQIYFDGWQVYNSVDDPYIWTDISCWTDETKDIAAEGEKINHASRFSIETSSTTFTNIQKKYSGSWTSLTGTSCEAVNTTTPHRDYCSPVSGGSGLFIWTADN
jgi:hypothetical protein